MDAVHDVPAQPGMAADRTFLEILDRLSTNVCITDLNTDEILFMNETMKRAFGVSQPEGRHCWEVVQQGMTRRCAFCQVPELALRTPEDPPVTWEEYNTCNGHTYENYDSVMRWNDGRLVHVQNAVDVTLLRRLSEAVNVDDLTQALKRAAGKAAIQDLLDRGAAFSLAMLDVDSLKEVNDRCGHQSGDALLVEVADAVRSQMAEGDLLCRISGDEFVAVLQGVDYRESVRRMECAQALVLREFCGRKISFSFGAVEVGRSAHLTLSGLLDVADERLYTYKRSHAPKDPLPAGRPEAPHASGFTYDTSLLYDALTQSTDDYIYLCNMKTGVFRYPQRMAEDFALPGEIVADAMTVWGAKVHEHDKEAFLEANQEIMEGRSESHCVEYRAQNRNGEWVWLRCRGHLERDADGEPSLFAGIITNLGKKNKIDPLTGLFNKFVFQDEAQRLLQNAGFSPLAIMIFGIDDLKHVNNLYDRVFGDEVIRIVSQRIQSLLPPNAQVFRLDGDEFGVMIRSGDKSVAQSFFYAVRESFSMQQSYEGRKFSCTLSCGCVFAPKDGSDYQQLLKYANYAFDYAKHSGKNRVAYFSADILARMERRLELTELLRESIENGYAGFEVHFQPVFSVARKLVGAEALTRWSCKAYGRVSPEEFIGLLEEGGLIAQAGRWIFRQAVRQCRSFLKLKSDFTLSINLSCLQLEEPGLVDFIRDTLAESEVPPECIILELTESYLAANLTRLTSLLGEFHALGIRVAMDDFGTGYSSLSLLKQAPIDIAKIDRAFVQGIQKSDFDRSLIRMVVELCHIVGIHVCLEGVETEEEYEITAPTHIDYLQGFLLGRPCSGDEFEARFLSGQAGRSGE